MKKEDGWVVWLLVRVTAIIVWHGSALVPAQAPSWLLALALRLAAQLSSILASLISSPCRQTTQSAQHVSEHCRIRSPRLRSARTCSYSTSSKPFRGPSREPQIARCVRLGSPLHLAAAACARHLWALQVRWTVGICTPYLNFGFRTRATAL